MKLNYLNKLPLFYLLVFIVFIEFFILFGAFFYDIYLIKIFKSNYISIYSILRIIYKTHFIGIPINIVILFIEYLLKKKTFNVGEQKLSKLAKTINASALIAFLAVTVICLFIGYPPTPEELMYD